MAFARSDISVDVNQYSYHWVQLVSVVLFVWWQAIGLYSQIFKEFWQQNNKYI